MGSSVSPSTAAQRRFACLAALACAFVVTTAPDALAQKAPEEPPADDDKLKNLAKMDLEDLLDTNVEVWSATKMAGKSDEVAAIITVYSREDIKKWGYDSVAELLTHALGFYVVDDHVIPNVAVRGISGGLGSESSMIKVMIDGHSVAFRSTGGNFIGPELIPLSAVERVEIIRGPGSTLYGADAFLGVVNIVTRDGDKLSGGDLGAWVRIDGKNVGSGQDVSVGTSIGPASVLLSFRHDERDLSGLRLPRSSPAPLIPSYADRNAPIEGLMQTSNVGYARVVFRTKKVAIALSGYASALDREAAFSPWTQLAYGLDSRGRQNQNEVSLIHGHAAANIEVTVNDKLTLTLDSYLFRGGPTANDHIDVGSDLYFIRRNFGFFGTDTNFEARWKPIKSLTAITGVGIVWDREQLPSTLTVLKQDTGGASAGDVVPSLSTRQGTKDFLNPSAYALAVFTPFDPQLSFTGGFRYDNHNVYGDVFSGRFGVVSSPVKDLHLKALYGNAFKAPSPLLLYGVPLRAGDIIGNADLKPQFVHTVEGLVSYRFFKALSASTGVAYNYLRDKAEFTQLGSNRIAKNLAEVHSLSWETGLKLQVAGWVEAYSSFELNQTSRKLGEIGYRADLLGDQNTIFPSAMFKGGALFTVPKVPLRAGFEVSYVGSRRATDDNILESGRGYDLDSYFMMGATVSTVGIKLIREKETAIFAVGRNLSGVRAADPGFAGVDYPISERSFLIGARQEL